MPLSFCRPALRLFAATLLAGLAAAADAQIRSIPVAAETGKLTVLDHRRVKVEHPEISLLDMLDRSVLRLLAPGARIFNEQNRSIHSNALPEGSIASFLVGQDGQIRTIWVLTPAEFEAYKARPKR